MVSRRSGSSSTPSRSIGYSPSYSSSRRRVPSESESDSKSGCKEISQTQKIIFGVVGGTIFFIICFFLYSFFIKT